MKTALLIVILQAVFVSQSFQESTDRLKVSIYYEALCPDSIGFINRQFYPAYQKINSSLLIDFVPYGKATHTKTKFGDWIFECQHGPMECWENKVQACGIAQNKTQDANVEFVDCVMSKPFEDEAIEKCAPKLGVTEQVIKYCAHSATGNELHAQYGDRTHALRSVITFIPTIIFNDSYDSILQRGALSNFLETACGLLEKKPAECSTASNVA